MLIEKRVDQFPLWAEKCRRTTISKLLTVLQDRRVDHIVVRIVQNQSYIIVMHKGATQRFSYFQLHAKHWTSVHHIINAQPFQCTCWVCRWRRLRQRYMNPDEFNHLFVERIKRED